MALGDLGAAEKLKTISPSNSVNLSPIPRAIRVAAAGTVKITAAGNTDADAVTITGVLAGEVLEIAVKKLWASGTSATGFTAYY